MDYIALYFIIGLIICIFQIVLKKRWVNFVLFIPFVIVQLAFTYYCYTKIDTILDEYFRIDRISIIFMTVLSIVSIPSMAHSAIYSVERKDTDDQLAYHNASITFFIMCMTGALISNHLGLMWAFVEGTTLVSAVMIYHDRDRSSLEATWKYFFVSSIGLALAYIGILFFGIAGQESQHLDLSVTALVAKAPSMSPLWLKVGFLFAVVGYSVKMGVAPLFSVDIDAKDKAPSPVGALFSGGLMNVGYVAIFRFYEILSVASTRVWTDKILVVIGIVSIFFAAIYLMKVKNIKRILAYSSVEHAGIALIALGAGGIGHFASIFHLIFHSFAKASLFLQVGQVYRIYLNKNIDKIGGYFNINPSGATVMFLGFLCIIAVPPSGMFLSELYTFMAVFNLYHWAVGGFLIVCLTFIFASFVNAMLQLLFARFPGKIATYDVIHPWETVSQFMMIGFVLYMGIFPNQWIVQFVSDAVKHLPK